MAQPNQGIRQGRAGPPPPSIEGASQEAAQVYLDHVLNNYMDQLPVGQSGNALRLPGYRQPDGRTCFYTALGAAAAARQGREIDVAHIGQRAEAEGLLDGTGAATGSQELRARQQDFIRHVLGLEVNFLSPREFADCAHALTIRLWSGHHVIFPMPRHWVALDGFRRLPDGRGLWTGIDPATGGRLEDSPNRQLGPARAIGRLASHEMPLVVVEGNVDRRVIGPRRVRTTEPQPSRTVQPKPAIRSVRPSPAVRTTQPARTVPSRIRTNR